MNNNIVNNNLGSIIKNLRIELGISQQQLADNTTYSRDYISKIELGKRYPPEDLIISLSTCLNIDLLTLSKKINNYKNFNHYLASNKLISCIETQDLEQIKHLLLSDNIYAEFIYGEPLIIKNYCLMLVLFHIDKNFDKCLSLAQSTLDISLSDITNYNFKVTSNYYYYSILLVLCSLIKLNGDYTLLLNFEKNFISFLDKNYFSNIISIHSVDYYFKKLYTVLLNNLADTYFNILEFDNALTFCNIGIEKCNFLNIISTLPMLLKLKTEILYSSNNITEAKATYSDFHSICNITNNLKYFENTSSLFRNNYPLIVN